MQQQGFASIAAVLQYLRYAENRKLDTATALQKAGIAPSVLREQSGRIPGEQFERFIAALIEQSGDKLLGLHSSEFVQPDSYSVLGYITMSCRTIGEAIDCIVPFEKLVGDMGVTTIRYTPKTVMLDWHCAYPDPKVRPHMIDNVLASWTRYARWLSNSNTAPEFVELERPPADDKEHQAYTNFFGCAVHFACKQNRIALARDLLDTPLRQPDLKLREALEAQAARQLSQLRQQGESDLSTTIRVKQALFVQLRMGVTDKHMIAAQMGMTERTLQRHLAKEGMRYQTILDEVRAELAKNLLIETDLGLEDIAFNLGFNDARSFYRRCKVWFGQTPGAFRAESATPLA
ncbi:MAG: AraC family transcriptional regulator ligand-binding domain-containing protein [Oleiphilaceae bacterium]|nr:AraC family transcriptional regulator ligand-binding domain-containing protein [Oleiphilaceae bacterium]